MPYCSKCRTYIPDGASVCPGCGNVSGKHRVQPPQNTAQQNTTQNASVKTNYFKKIFKVDDYTYECDQSDIDANTNYSYLAYLGILVIIPFIVARKSKYAMFHACQGLLNSIFFVVYLAVVSICSLMVNNFLSAVIMLICHILILTFPIFAIVGIVNVIRKKATTLPLFGRLKLAKALFKNDWGNM